MMAKIIPLVAKRVLQTSKSNKGNKFAKKHFNKNLPKFSPKSLNVLSLSIQATHIGIDTIAEILVANAKPPIPIRSIRSILSKVLIIIATILIMSGKMEFFTEYK